MKNFSIVCEALVRQNFSFEKFIKEIENAIEDIVKTLPEGQCLTGVPGIGKVYAGGIIAETSNDSLIRTPSQQYLYCYSNGFDNGLANFSRILLCFMRELFVISILTYFSIIYFYKYQLVLLLYFSKLANHYWTSLMESSLQ